RALRADRGRPRARRGARAQEARARRSGHAADARPALRRPARRNGAARRRADVPARARARTGGRAPADGRRRRRIVNITRETRARPLFDAPLVRRAVLDSFRKLDPRVQLKNPVMFVVWVGACLTSALAVQAAVGNGDAPFGFVLSVALWLWL